MAKEFEHYFDKEKQQKAIDHINKYWNPKTCEVCRNTTWDLFDFLIASPRFEGRLELGGRVAPHIMLTCKKCGNTKFFNAVNMDIVKGDSRNE